MLVKDLKQGMVVYECEGGRDIRMEVVYDAYRDVSMKYCCNGWSCLVESSFGRLTLFQDHKVTHYGPRIYTDPQYGNVR